MNQYGIAIEDWSSIHRLNVWSWLADNFGPEGGRWGIVYDYGLDNLWMNEDVFIFYKLKWAR